MNELIIITLAAILLVHLLQEDFEEHKAKKRQILEDHVKEMKELADNYDNL